MIVKKFGGIPLLWELFFVFFKIGLFTFGGGYAMISVIEDLCVEKYRWITHQDMATIVTVAESTPGPIAINAATYVGYHTAGMLGAIAATFGVVLPSFVIIYSISLFLDNFLELTLIANAFKGIKIAVGLLILDAGIRMSGKLPKTAKVKVLMLGSMAIMLLTDLFSIDFSSITLILFVGIASLAAALVKGGKAE